MSLSGGYGCGRTAGNGWPGARSSGWCGFASPVVPAGASLRTSYPRSCVVATAMATASAIRNKTDTAPFPFIGKPSDDRSGKRPLASIVPSQRALASRLAARHCFQRSWPATPTPARGLDDLAQLAEGGSRNFSIACSTEKLPGRAENSPRSTPFRLLMTPPPYSVLGSVGCEEISRRVHARCSCSLCGRGWRVGMSLLKSSPV